MRINLGIGRKTQRPDGPKPDTGESRLKRIEQYMTFLRSAVYTLVIAGIGIAACLFIPRELKRLPLTIEPISVPPSLLKRGYTADVVGSRLADRVQYIYATAKSDRPALGLQRPAWQKPDVQVPGVGVSLQSMVSIVRDFSNNPETRVRGEVTVEKEGLRLWLRSSTGAASSVGPFAENKLDDLLERGGLEIIKLTTPQIAADYLYDLEAETCSRTYECKFRETIAVLKMAAAPESKDDDRKRAQLLWGYVRQVHQKQPEEAIKHYEEALKIDSNYALALSNLGGTLVDLERPKEALPLLQKAVKLDPKLELAHDNLGIALRDLDSPAEAVEKHRKAMKLNPSYGNAYRNWGVTLNALKCPEQAVEKYSKGVELMPKDADTFNQWGNFLLSIGRVDEAVEKYTVAIEMRSKPEFRENLRKARRDRIKFENAAREHLQAGVPDKGTCDKYAA